VLLLRNSIVVGTSTAGKSAYLNLQNAETRRGEVNPAARNIVFQPPCNFSQVSSLLGNRARRVLEPEGTHDSIGQISVEATENIAVSRYTWRPRHQYKARFKRRGHKHANGPEQSWGMQ
jgi:hypothetical protein